MINVISFGIDNSLVDGLFELIDSDLFTPTCRYDVESGLCRLEVFFEDAAQDEEIRTALSGAAGLIGIEPEFESSQIEEKDWSESWKRFFHVEHISRRLVIRPTWEEYDAKPDEHIISLDPGMSFGTGKHATTKGCLILLDSLADECPGFTFLDMGCGSGILSIGAKMLGFNDVRGFDNDPDCVRISTENAQQNNLNIPFYAADLEKSHPQAQIVVANILASILVQYADSIAGSLIKDESSRLILSGILDSQYDSVKERFEKAGLKELSNMLIEEWRSGVFGVASV